MTLPKEVRSLSVVMPVMNSVDKLTFLISFVIFDMKGEKLIQTTFLKRMI